MQDQQSFVEDRVSRAAVRMVPYGNVDRAARDQDDYAQILRTSIWLNWDNISDDAKWDRWTTKVISFQTKTMKRGLGRMAKRNDYVDTAAIPDPPDVESYIISKNLLARLRDMIGSGDWELLVAWTNNDFNMRATWDDLGQPMSYAHFRRRIKDLQDRCRNILRAI